MDVPKYSLAEIERRWLVRRGEAERLLNHPKQLAQEPRLIRDKYLSDTRMRLRQVTAPAADPVFKLCKKYGDKQGPTESITNIYLTESEYEVFDQLPGAVVTKSRHLLALGGIDVYATAEGDRYIFEMGFADEAAAAAFVPPAFADREITEDTSLTGHALAKLCAHPDGIVVERATARDYALVLELNESALPHVNSIDMRALEQLAAQSISFTVARKGDSIAGFLLVLGDGADYASLNYRYFCGQYPSFAYVDRIVVKQGYRGAGIGSLLYTHLLIQGAGDKSLVACEVNLRPPNPASVSFHERLGFAGVAEQDTDEGRKRVLLMTKQLISG
jgi:predicted GNAT superfamily acetyltransferase/CYTH domain-containing protein